MYLDNHQGQLHACFPYFIRLHSLPESTIRISTVMAASVWTYFVHNGLQLSPSQKVKRNFQNYGGSECPIFPPFSVLFRLLLCMLSEYIIILKKINYCFQLVIIHSISFVDIDVLTQFYKFWHVKLPLSSWNLQPKVSVKRRIFTIETAVPAFVVR